MAQKFNNNESLGSIRIKLNANAEEVDALSEAVLNILENDATTEYVDDALINKVDKVANKGLSTNDYTTAEKNKLAALTNQDVSNLATKAELNAVDDAVNLRIDNLIIEGGDAIGINDAVVSSGLAWSSAKIMQELNKKIGYESVTYIEPDTNNNVII